MFGGNRQAVAAAATGEQQAQENYYSAQASLAAETALAYLDLRAGEARLAVLRQSIGTREEITRLARWRSEAGEIDALKLEQAESSIQQAHAAIDSLEQTTAQTCNRLALLAGRTPGFLDGLLASRRCRAARWVSGFLPTLFASAPMSAPQDTTGWLPLPGPVPLKRISCPLCGCPVR